MDYVARSREDGAYQTLEEHLNNTARLSGEFAAAFGAADWGHAIGRYHDVGKSSQAFQNRILRNGPRTDHSTAGAQEICKYYGAVAAYCVAGHHGGLPNGGSPVDTGDDSSLYGRMKKKLKSLCDYAAAGEPPKPATHYPLADASPSAFSLALLTRMLASCLVDADRLDSEAFAEHGQVERGGYLPVETLSDRLTGHMDQFGPPTTVINEKRAEILAACRDMAEEDQGLFSLTVPTGGGKTLSSLAFALAHAKKHGLKRVIYVIPYITITEQTADTFCKALGDDQVVEHHANATFDEEDPQGLRLRLSTENWDATVIVTTSVQFFESLFAARTSRLRKLHNIARSVVIFDEAQMIPLPYLKPCVEAIAELVHNYSCTAVLMSATQPALGPFFPEGMPLREMMPDPVELYRFFRRTTLENLGGISEEALLAQLREREQVLCIVNTRKLAQRLYKALREEGTFHLSTLMHPEHRRAVLKEVRQRLKEGKPCRVISTSLIEAGVDVDFPAVYREEAGLDSIIQSMGRCNREGKRLAAESRAYVFRLEGDDAPSIPASMGQAVSVARDVFGRFEDASSLEAIEAYFQNMYYVRGQGLDQKRIVEMTEQDIGKGGSIPFRDIEKAFQLIDSNTQSVVIATDPDASALVDRLQAGEHSRALLRAMGAYTVNIYQNHLQALHEAGALLPLGEDGWMLTMASQYDEDMGLKLDVETGNALFS